MQQVVLPTNIRYLLRIYLLGIVCFTLLRFVLFFTQWENVTRVPSGIYYFGYAFVMGWRFDTSICGYLLLVPLVLLTAWRIREKKDKWLAYLAYYFINTVFILAFFVGVIDIPYFSVFSARLNVAILNWTSNLGFGLGMVAKEPANWAYTMVFLSISYFFYFQSKKHFYGLVLPVKSYLRLKIRTVILVSLLFIGLAILAIRGRLTEKSPIRIGTAYFSQHTFPNQLGLNAVFTFFKSYLESRKPDNEFIHLMDEEKAKGFVSYEFKSNPEMPALRKVGKDSQMATTANVIVVVMESMTTAKMGRYGNTDALTPFLDSLARTGLSFDNAWSAGIHTHNGIYGTLFSQPALFRQHSMNKSVMHPHTGFAKILMEKKYQTAYFTTHDDQFDNVGGFLTNSFFQKIVSQADYPSEAVESTLGVPDHVMFDFAMPILDAMSASSQPFFAAFMTASDHMPYHVPDIDGVNFGTDDIKNRVVRYADWSIRHFIEQASKRKWFTNTVFVFVADHGVSFGPGDYDPPLCVNHIPLIFWDNNHMVKQQSILAPACQIDAFPTALGLLNISYTNHTLGVDLLNEGRRFAYFCADDKVGCVSDSLLYIYRLEGPESLHFYKKKSLDNVISTHSKEAALMKDYAFAMMQTSQWMIKEGITK